VATKRRRRKEVKTMKKFVIRDVETLKTPAALYGGPPC
jgi:hypothetical protein